MKTKKVKNYMTKKVITFKPSDKIINAAKVFVKTRISGAPVIDHGMVAGIVSVSDLTKTIDLHFENHNFVHPSPEGLVISLLKTAVDYKKHRKKMKEIGAETVGQIMTRKIENAKVTFGNGFKTEIPVDFPINSGEGSQPSLIGVDFMLKTGAKLFFDPTNKEAYSEIEN